LANGFTVKNFHALCRDLATAAGIPFRPPEDPEAARQYWETEPPKQPLRALDAFPEERFEAVIVDEGQDFLKGWWKAVERLLRDVKRGVLWVFFDPLQNLYGGGPTEALGLVPASLTSNCRNTVAIGTLASNFVKATPVFKLGTPQGIAVQEICCNTERDMLEAVSQTLHRLLSEESIPADTVVVLTAASMKSSRVWQTGKFGPFSLVEFPVRPGPGQVPFATLQRFKGLEADVILLCEVHEQRAHCTPNHLYVGTSRARHALVIAKYASGTGASPGNGAVGGQSGDTDGPLHWTPDAVDFE
jgi:hypothetical protein